MSPPAKPSHYLDIYRDLFVRFPIRSVVELGVHRGGSLRFFAELGATVTGVDHDLSMVEAMPDGVRLVQGDASDPAVLAPLEADLVVDDASHFWDDQQRSFSALWPRTRLLYVIEDLELCYRTEWARGRNTVDWLKEMVDDVLQTGAPTSIAFHPGLVVIAR